MALVTGMVVHAPRHASLTNTCGTNSCDLVDWVDMCLTLRGGSVAADLLSATVSATACTRHEEKSQ